MWKRVREDRRVRELLVSFGIAYALVFAILLFLAVQRPPSADRLVLILSAIAASALAMPIAIAVRIRLEWDGRPAMLVGASVVLAIFALLPIEGFNLAFRSVIVLLALALFLSGYWMRRSST